MDWDDLKVLEALQRLGTVGRAARDLGVSSATVYRRIAAIEEHVGVPCLQRGARRGEKLTDAGAALAAVGRSTRVALDSATQELRASEETVAGVVSLTTVEGFVPLLGRPLEALARRHPELTVEVHIDHVGPSVRERAVDVAIAVMANPPEVLVGRRLMAIPYGVFGTLEATRRDPPRWLTLGPPMHTSAHARWEATHAGDVAVRSGSRLLLTTLARRGLGVAVMPRLLGALYEELVELEDFRESLQELELDAWVLTHPDLRSSARVTALMDALARAFDGDASR